MAAQSPGSVPSTAAEQSAGGNYLRAWDALSALLTQGHSLSGHERNCCFLNTHDSPFADISATAGFDFPSDTRGVAVVDWDHDGDLDVWLSNRTSPRLRFLRNEIRELTAQSDDRVDAPSDHWLAFRLEGTRCNRDAIGARITVQTRGVENPLKSVRTLRAGEGYLSQSSKWIHFGLGMDTAIEMVEVRWPDGQVERIRNVDVDQHFVIVQGSSTAMPWQRPAASLARTTPPSRHESQPDDTGLMPIRVVAHRRLPIPDLHVTDAQVLNNGESQPAVIPSDGQHATLIVVWAPWCAPCVDELSTLATQQSRLRQAHLKVATLCVDQAADAAALLQRLGADWLGGVANEATKIKLDLLQRFLVSREDPLSIPMSLMLDPAGRLAIVYKGTVPIETLERDAALVRRGDSDTRDAAVPLPGTWYVNPMPPDLMSLVEKLVAAGLHEDALSYLNRNLRPLVESGTQPTSIWPASQIADAYFRIGVELARRDRPGNAEAALVAAIDLAPDLLVARAAMANLMQTQGRVADALRQYEVMRQRQPDNPLILNDIAWLLATTDEPQMRDPAEAIRLAEQACRLTNYQLIPTLDTLAAAYASDGRFADAADAIQRALVLARAKGQTQRSEALREKLKQYRTQVPSDRAPTGSR